MAYDEKLLRQKIDEALTGFIHVDTIALGRAAVIDAVTAAALDMLTLICGDPGGSRPQGILNYKPKGLARERE